MLRQINVDEIPNRCNRTNRDLRGELLGFIHGDWSAAEVDVTHYVSAEVATTTYRAAVKRALVDVTVVRRGNRVFLIRGGVR